MIIWQTKKIIFVIIAALVGIGIIFFALVSTQNIFPRENSATTDSDWEKSLQVVSNTPSINAAGSATRGDISTTGLIAQKIIPDYLATQGDKEGSMSDKEAEAFAEKLLAESASSSLRQYTEKDLNIVEAGAVASETYKRGIEKAMNTLLAENSFNELLLVARALDSRKEVELAPLAQAITNYQKLIATLLSMKIPRDSVAVHLYFIQSYSTILSGVEDMQEIIVDPIQGLQGISKYKKGLEMLSQTPTLFPYKK